MIAQFRICIKVWQKIYLFYIAPGPKMVCTGSTRLLQPLRLKNSIMAPARFPITGSTRLFLLDVHIPYSNEFSHCLGVCLFFVDYMRYRCRQDDCNSTTHCVEDQSEWKNGEKNDKVVHQELVEESSARLLMAASMSFSERRTKRPRA